MTDDDPRIDPRYDPAFQRGFAGQVVSTSRARRPAPPPEPERHRTGHDAPASEPASPLRDPGPAEDTGTPQDAVTAARPVLHDLLRNPFLVAATVLGVLLVIVGAVWLERARQLVSGTWRTGTEADYWFLQATVVAAPATILVGVAIVAGVLLFCASAWSRRR